MPDQLLLPLARLGVQELGEVALRQHHAGAEVAERQPEQLARRRVGDVAGAVGQRLGLLVGGRPCRTGRAAAPAARRAPTPRRTRRAAARGRRRSARRRRRTRAGRCPRSPSGRARAPPCAPVVPARHRAVERERDRVDHGGLARAGRPDQREVVGAGEVDGRGLAERARSRPSPAGPASSRSPAGDLVVQACGTAPRRAGRRRPAVPRYSGTAPTGALASGAARPDRDAVTGRGELGVDAHLERVRQHRRHLLPQPGPGGLADPDPQAVVAERRQRGPTVPRRCRARCAAGAPP